MIFFFLFKIIIIMISTIKLIHFILTNDFDLMITIKWLKSNWLWESLQVEYLGSGGDVPEGIRSGVTIATSLLEDWVW